MNDIEKLKSMGAEQTLIQIAQDLCRKRAGLTKNFEVKLVTITDYINKKVDVAVVAGNPPTILVSSEFFILCLYEKNGKILLRDRLERAIEKAPKVTRSIHNLVPLSLAIELRRESRRWVKSLVPNYVRSIPDRFFKVEYSVTVTEELTRMSITLNGCNVKELERVAKSRLTSAILESEEMEELFEMIRNEQHANVQKDPSQVTITTMADGVVKTEMEY